MFGTDDASYAHAVSETWTAKSPSDLGEFGFLVHCATLAANSHNTQPWLFSRSGNAVGIRPDVTRATPAADPDAHHLYASLGCAAENLVLAAAQLGKAAAVSYQPDADGLVEIDLVAENASPDPLFGAIIERQCTRSVYDGRPVGGDETRRLEAAARIDGCRVIVVADKTMIERILELSLAANTSQINDAKFADELKSWLRFDASQAIETRDGLYSACSGNPALPPFLGRIMFGLTFKAGAENDRLASQVRSSSGLAVFVTEKDDKAHWVQSGRSYERFALQATALGIRHAFVNQPVDVPSVRSEFSRLLGIGNQRADLVVRYGYGPAMPRSLRRPIDSVIV